KRRNVARYWFQQILQSMKNQRCCGACSKHLESSSHTARRHINRGVGSDQDLLLPATNAGYSPVGARSRLPYMGATAQPTQNQSMRIVRQNVCKVFTTPATAADLAIAASVSPAARRRIASTR